jgi:aminoglycoside phosphotransferase (APT) family kinase protein
MDGKDVIPARTWNRHAEVWEKTLASVNRHKELPLTLMHGDVHLKNWYIAGNGEMGLGDWQCVSRGHWSRDVCYAISSALTVEHRRAWERELLAYYLDELAASGGPKVALDDALLDYRQQLMTALTWWTITLAPTDDIPDMQPKDITLEMVRRIGTACDDWDSLDSF